MNHDDWAIASLKSLTVPSNITDLVVDDDGALIVTTETGISKLTTAFLLERIQE